MSISEEQFDQTLYNLQHMGMDVTAAAIRARDTAQRETLARVEAEAGRLAEAGLAAHVKATAAQAQLAEAVGLLKHVKDWFGWGDLPESLSKLDSFLARHAQAEQQEAQGAQAGDELERLSVTNILLDVVPGPDGMGHEVYAKSVEQVERRLCDLGDRVEELTDELAKARAALATQPAAGEPVADAKQLAASLKLVRSWERPGQATEWEFEVPGSFNRHVVASSEQVARAKIAQDVRREAPPAAAHGDEAVRKDATESAIQRACKELPEGWSLQIELERGAGDVTLFNAWDIVVDFGQDFESSISEQVEAAIDAAMRAQGDGEPS